MSHRTVDRRPYEVNEFADDKGICKFTTIGYKNKLLATLIEVFNPEQSFYKLNHLFDHVDLLR